MRDMKVQMHDKKNEETSEFEQPFLAQNNQNKTKFKRKGTFFIVLLCCWASFSIYNLVKYYIK